MCIEMNLDRADASMTNFKQLDTHYGASIIAVKSFVAGMSSKADSRSSKVSKLDEMLIHSGCWLVRLWTLYVFCSLMHEQ